MSNQNKLEEMIEDMVVYTRRRFRKDRKSIERVARNTELSTSTISRLSSPGKRITALTLFTLMCEANPLVKDQLYSIINSLKGVNQNED